MINRGNDTFSILLNESLAEKERIFKLSKAILNESEELVVQLLVNADDYDRMLNDDLRKKVLSIIKGIVPEGLAARFYEAYGLDYPAIVSRLYSQEGPSRFLGSFARFVIENKDDDYASGLIRKNLVDFIERVLMRYGCREVGIVGSMGIACRDELMELGRMYGLDFVRFIKSPIEELVRYHGI